MRCVFEFDLIVCSCPSVRCIECLQLRHVMTSLLLPYGKKHRVRVELEKDGAAAVVQLLLQTRRQAES